MWLAGWAILAGAAAGIGAAEHLPNVLFIAVDDLNDWVGCLGGHPQAKTPHIDRLAVRGTVFTSAHCQAPLCNPSRTSVLLGLRPSTTGIHALAPWFRTIPALANRPTLFETFRMGGYVTATCGKVFHDAYPPKADRRDGAEVDVWGHHGSFGPWPNRKLVDAPAKMNAMDWGVFPARDEDQDDFKVASWASEWLRRRSAASGKPFFLAVGFRRPHVPCFASKKWFDLYPENVLVLPPVKEDDREDVPRFASYLHWKLPEPRLKWLRQANQWKPL
ncbi:MAG TPA: sulfatase-like hydrolase/transferase, partial [Planctomycetia bacterium]|nr:sulfatase-like hydrolase/transferase [Planctomycetia bacterium]